MSRLPDSSVSPSIYSRAPASCQDTFIHSVHITKGLCYDSSLVLDLFPRYSTKIQYVISRMNALLAYADDTLRSP